jgi:uncharacterized protein (DUF1778 family)
MKRQNKIIIYLTEEEKDTLERASSMQFLSMSSFIRNSVLSETQNILKENQKWIDTKEE